LTYQFRIASPCSTDWNQMKGDDRVRFCEDCKLHVYNFSAMTPPEIEALISKREGRLCARLYQRPDGTTLTRNCPVGFRAVVLRASGFATATLSALLSIIPAATNGQALQKKEGAAQTRPLPASISLEIVDASGAAISGAQVTLKDEATGKETVLRADDTGRVSTSNLPKSQYEIRAVSPGFRTKTLTHVSIPDAELRRIQLDIRALMGVVVIQKPNPVKRLFSKFRHIA